MHCYWNKRRVAAWYGCSYYEHADLGLTCKATTLFWHQKSTYFGDRNLDTRRAGVLWMRSGLYQGAHVKENIHNAIQ